MSIQNFEHPYFSRRATVDNDTGDSHDNEQDGADTAEVLLGLAIRGILAGPLALTFEGNPEALGAFAARVVDGAHGHWYADADE